MRQSSLDLESKPGGPVECLGQKFPSEEARREHYLKLLAQKLKDPEFRKIEGFPIGKDEDILALSDPPHYTACPNPWLGEFIKCCGTPYDPKQSYHREPFAADVSEGKNHPIYNAHSYHTKVPHRAIMRYILHYTQPGDVVFDGFCGTGMAGVAAQLCGDLVEVQELGYRVQNDGTILNHEGKAFSKLGARRSILNDLSPFAAFIAARYNDFNSLDYRDNRFIEEILSEGNKCRDFYLTAGPKQQSKVELDYAIWSEVFACPNCQETTALFDLAVNKSTYELRDTFTCPSCGKQLSKEILLRVWTQTLDLDKTTLLKELKTTLVEVVAEVAGASRRFKPTAFDTAILKRVAGLPTSGIPTTSFPHGRQTRKVKSGSGIEKVHQMFTRRALLFFSEAWGKAISETGSRTGRATLFLLSACMTLLSKRERFRDGTGKGAQSGTLYVPSLQVEKNPFRVLCRKRKALTELALETTSDFSCITTGSHTDVRTIPNSSLDYIFTDPPFGESLQYGELNFFHESWLGAFSAISHDCVLNYVHEKDLTFYQRLMSKAFKECFRILKPGKWMTVEFSNTEAKVWNSIQTSLQEAGFVVANVSALDKQSGSFNAVTTTTAVKQDLIISAYKPDGGLEERFAKRGETEEGAWDFLRTHLKNLPVVKAKGGQMELIVERDPRILYDRMVAFYVGHSTPVPLSSAEFQAGLAEKFPERDGMVFLPEQVNEYDKKRSQVENIGQLSIFVEDERSAINWLRNFLKNRPSTSQDIHPEFMQQLSASWKKWETRPEMSALLDQNFLCYGSNGDVPSQIHGYLSTQYKALRNLQKNDERLQAVAKNRWYVPDPKKNVDVETLRNKRLIEEFWSYLPEGYTPPSLTANKGQTLPGLVLPRPKIPKGKKLKELRTEAVRVGFKHCYQKKDYATILVVAELLPESVLNEDEQLQMIYDTAVTRSSGGE